MILPLTSLCRFCLQYTETFVYFNDAIEYILGEENINDTIITQSCQLYDFRKGLGK